MSMQKINVKSLKTNREVTFEADLPDNLADAQARYGDEIVFSIFHSQLVVKVQAITRQRLDAVDEEDNLVNTPEVAIAAGQGYVPQKAGVRTVKDPLAELVAKVKDGKMTKEELIAEITARLKK